MLARASVANQFYFANVTLNGTNTITSESCSVTTNPVNVPLGDHDKASSAVRVPQRPGRHSISI